MAANKFATMLNRNTNKITIILIYAVLEWILITLLLLNSLFSHLITKFATYFGLKTPCLWCSRVDHSFGAAKSRKTYRDLVCDIHASEISQLGYCSEHKKLVKSQYMCKDCLFSQPFSSSSSDVEQTIAFYTCPADKKPENGETKFFKCSCCDVSLSSDLYPPYLSISVPRENDDKEEENGMAEEHKKLPYDDKVPGIHKFDEDNCAVYPVIRLKEMQMDEDEIADTTETIERELIKVSTQASPIECIDMIQFPEENIARLSSSLLTLENWSNFEDHFLVTIEPIDSLTFKKGNVSGLGEISKRQSENSDELLDYESNNQKMVNSIENMSVASRQETTIHLVEADNNTRYPVQEDELDVWEPELEYMSKAENKNFVEMLIAECNTDAIHPPSDQACLTAITQDTLLNDDICEGIELVLKDSVEPMGIEDSNGLIPQEMSDMKLSDQPQVHDTINSCLQNNSLGYYKDAENTTSSNSFVAEEGLQKAEEVGIEGTTIQRIEECIDHYLSKDSEFSDANEESATKNAFYRENLHDLHIISLLDKKESRTEESFSGSIVGEMSTADGILTIEHLKSVLKEERKARCTLYEELEEERSANAVAAKQTMEMITRLQEEKATVQMEALQYQRMMDEQSEYDQEALQLLNELVVKVEKEKHELQLELEIQRKKILHYEARERRIMKKKTASEISRTLSASFSNSEGSEPVDFDHESIDEYICNGHPESNNNTPANGVLNLEDVEHMSILDESLADFETEKLSILEKLKELEEKLFTLSDDEGECFEDIKPIVLFPDENTEEMQENEDFSKHEIISNGFSTDQERKQYKESGNTSPRENGFHLDTNGMETSNVTQKEEQPSNVVVSLKNSSASKFAEVNKRLAIEQEVDNVYERLQALEADREFLKQSISSLKKGDKGMDLLQEILQYLRDLRSVELCTRKMSDASLT